MSSQRVPGLREGDGDTQKHVVKGHEEINWAIPLKGLPKRLGLGNQRQENCLSSPPEKRAEFLAVFPCQDES